MLIPVLLFIVGLLCLIKGGDWFVDGATGIARRFHAVSYTHLDVYKRQELRGKLGIRNEELEIGRRGDGKK